jgi:hypothetical protein
VEVLKIAGGLAAIAVVVAVIAMDRKEESAVTTAAAAVPPARTFEARDSSARFVVPETAPEGAAPGEAAPQD